MKNLKNGGMSCNAGQKMQPCIMGSFSRNCRHNKLCQWSPCLVVCDPDGNGELELADAVYGLNFCFAGTDAPVAPFPECGSATTVDLALGCESSPCE